MQSKHSRNIEEMTKNDAIFSEEMTKNGRSYYLYTIVNILILFNFNDMTRTYQELITLPTFEERFKYCKLDGKPSELTFNGHRLLNQMLYRSPQWKSVRQKVILRDNGCDLGIADRPIQTNPSQYFSSRFESNYN